LKKINKLALLIGEISYQPEKLMFILLE
jgi:hypothetical protein